jgi:hypothetical protein
MKSYELEALLDGFKGKNISLHGKQGRLIKWEAKENVLKLITDQDDIIILNSDLDESLRQIEVSPRQDLEVIAPAPSVIRTNASNLAKIIMDNITKLKSDKEYISQAQEINNAAKTMIELAKVEVEYMKTINSMRKEK